MSSCLICTCDSVSMISEAIYSKKNVYIFRLKSKLLFLPTRVPISCKVSRVFLKVGVSICLVISSISFNAIAIVDSKAGIKWWALIWWNGVASKGVLKEVNNGLFKELFF